MAQILTVIILACQVTGTHNGSSYNTANYNEVKNVQINCQNNLIKCVKNKDSKKLAAGEALSQCLLER